MVDNYGSGDSFKKNVAMEFERNGERYAFLRWGQTAFDNFRVVPPGTGICHQVNLEYLSQVVWTKEEGGKTLAYPDTLVGTDSHTTMVNGLSRSEEQTSELQSLMRISYSVFCLKKKKK